MFVSAQTDRRIQAITGVKASYFIKRLPIKNPTLRRDAIRYIQDKDLFYHVKVNRVMELAAEDAMMTLLNDEYVKGKKTKYKGMTKLWADASGPFKVSKVKARIVITFTDEMKVKFDRFKTTIEYRDPAYGYLAYSTKVRKGGKPNPNKSRKRTGSVDPIHIGASRHFARYAITSVKLFGRQRPAGRMGTELEGLGLEPIHVKPKASAAFKDYVPFKRVGYPGRLNPDRVSGELGKYPLFVNLLVESKSSRYIFSQVFKALDILQDAWVESRDKSANVLAKKVDRVTSK